MQGDHCFARCGRSQKLVQIHLQPTAGKLLQFLSFLIMVLTFQQCASQNWALISHYLYKTFCLSTWFLHGMVSQCVQCQWAVTNCISTAHRQTGSSCWWLLHWNIRLGWFFFNIAKMVLWKLEHIEIEAKNDFWRQIWSLKSHISEVSRILKKMIAEFWFIKLFTLFSEKKIMVSHFLVV